MHLMIPHACSAGEAGTALLADLPLPQLSLLLGLLQPHGPRLGSDEYSFNTPLELALAGLRGSDNPAETAAQTQPGTLPTAAWLAHRHGLSAAGQNWAWALLTPLHLSVGSDQITALAPAALNLSEAESREFFAILGELWPADEGWQAHWIAPTQWLIAHPKLTGLASASLDRVVQRSVDVWMPQARGLRTLQNEVQMLLHGQTLNDAREARGALPLNSVWISGCGAAESSTLPADLQLDERLREPLLNSDWAAWADAWRALDAGPVAQALALATSGQTVQLTLCGERHAQSYTLPPCTPLRRLWQRLLPRQADTARLLGLL
jgi:hypothetical protein